MNSITSQLRARMESDPESIKVIAEGINIAYSALYNFYHEQSNGSGKMLDKLARKYNLTLAVRASDFDPRR